MMKPNNTENTQRVLREEGRYSLKREIGWYDSFCLSYADVGADVYIALGVTAMFAAGGTPLAFIIGSLLYVSIGLAYAELASTYPLAGGAQVYAMRAFNDLLGFLAGWMLMLDYVIDIALFTVAATGYLGFMCTFILSARVELLPGVKFPSVGLVAIAIILLLMAVNYVGIKPSARFTAILVTINLFITAIILTLGYLLTWNFEKFISDLGILGGTVISEEVSYTGFLNWRFENFLYGLTLAMSSFIGIETIAQAAEETKAPRKTIPKAASLAIMAVIIGVIGYSVLGLGVLGWRGLAKAQFNPVAAIAEKIPIVGIYIASFVAAMGFMITVASANTGVIGVSRLAYSMGKFLLLPRKFYRVHPRYRTPTQVIIIFSVISIAIVLWGMLQPNILVFISSLYNFGALLSYMLVLASLIVLRNTDKNVIRPFKVPVNIRLKGKKRELEIPLPIMIGLIGIACMWSLVIVYHSYVRILGTLWIAIGLLVYYMYRKAMKIPLRSILGREMLAYREVDEYYK